MKRILSAFGFRGLFTWMAWSISRKVYSFWNGSGLSSEIQWLRQSHSTITSTEGNYLWMEGSLEGKSLRYGMRRGTSDALVLRQIFILQEYQPVVTLVSSTGSAVRRVLDCGANIGATSLYFKTHYPDAEVIAVEADPSNFKALEMTFQRNGLSHTTVLNKGIWHRNHRLSMSTAFRDGQEWSHEVIEDPAGAIDGITLKQIMENSNWDSLDILKIDIEGAERYLVNENRKEFAGVLAVTKFVAIEVHPEFNTYPSIFELLSTMGFFLIFSNETLFGINSKLISR